jgi:hypothetical protein
MLNGKFDKINYHDLPKKAQESYNFQKASAVLADYGFVTNLLKYDWLGADFLAQHINGEWLKVQLKGRLTLDHKYCNKNLYIMFEHKKESKWYLYPHDDFFEKIKKEMPNISKSTNGYSTPTPSKKELLWLKEYEI